MESALETRSWNRGFAAGFLVLALSVGGQTAAASLEAQEGRSCSYAGRSLLAERLFDRFAPRAESAGIAQRVARAVLGAVLRSCS
jgi:hypothetical protein